MKKLAAILLLFTLFSCEKSVYSETVDFADNQWKRDDIKTFKFNIENSGRYDIFILYRHVYGIPFREIPLAVTFAENGKSPESMPFDLSLADEQGNGLSDCVGDICDIEATLMQSRELAAGNYIVTLVNTFDHDYLPNTPAIGIKVKASDQ